MMSLIGYNPTKDLSLNAGVYHHVALTISGNTHTLYLDGSVVAINTNAGNIYNSYNTIEQLYIGCAGDLSYGFTGIIDDFRIFNRALPYSDIINLYSLTLDKLSISAKGIMISNNNVKKQSGALGVRLLYSEYTGPVMQIKVGTYAANVNADTFGAFTGTDPPIDFYAPRDGTTGINVLTDISGNTLASYITPGQVCYVTKWYDQTGNSNHASCAYWFNYTNNNFPYHSAAAQTLMNAAYNNDFRQLKKPYINTPPPIFNTINNVVDFSNNSFFKLPDYAFPLGNSAYTYIFKPIFNNIDSKDYPIYRGGNSLSLNNTYNYCQGSIRNTPVMRYINSWYNNDIITGTTTLPQFSVIADGYNGNSNATSNFVYSNGISRSVSTRSGGSGNTSRIQDGSNNIIGGPSTNINYFIGTLPYFMWANANLSASDINILGNTPV